MGRSNADDQPAYLLPPPVLYIVPMVSMLGVHYLVKPLMLPWPELGFASAQVTRIVAGVTVGVIGAGFVIGAVRQLRRAETSHTYFGATTAIVTGGPFRVTRNPIYLGTALAYVGISLGVGSVWVLGSLVLVVVLTNLLAIRVEEQYLGKKFGKEYLEYKAAIRRWL